MEITHGYKSYRSDRRSSLTIGNFDGYHLGHQRILDALVDASRTSGTRSVLISFLPHPLQLLMPEKAPRAITPLEEKIRLLGASRLEVLAILDFDRGPVPSDGRGVRARDHTSGFTGRSRFSVGSDFAFGHRRTGSVALLRKLSLELDFQVRICPQVVVRGSRVSSTRIRELIHAGRISSANRLLGRYFTLTGTVVAGRGLGRESLFPTLNLRPGAELIPRPGVYVTQTTFDRQTHPSVTNVGWRPTVAGRDLTVETHLIDTQLESPPVRLSLAFLHRLRDEEKFESLQQLKAQISQRLTTRPPLLSSLQPVGPTGGAGRLIAGLPLPLIFNLGTGSLPPHRISHRLAARLLRLPLKGGVIVERLMQASRSLPPLRGSRREGGARSRAGGGQMRRPVSDYQLARARRRGIGCPPPTASAIAWRLGFCDSPSRGE